MTLKNSEISYQKGTYSKLRMRLPAVVRMLQIRGLGKKEDIRVLPGKEIADKQGEVKVEGMSIPEDKPEPEP